MTSVLFVIDTLRDFRGTELHLFELAKRLPAHGVAPVVCTLGGDEPVGRAMAAAGIEVWPLRIERIHAPSGLAQVRRLVERARTRGIRSVQTFHFKADCAGALLALSLNVPWLSSRRDLGFAYGRRHRVARRLVQPLVSRFIAPSQAVRAALVAEGVPIDRIALVSNGVDVERFARAPRTDVLRLLGVSEEIPVAGMVAGLSPVKDHTTLLRALARVPALQLVLVGEGPEERVLRELCGKLGVSQRVFFAGARRDVPELLAALDLFVLSSRSEGCPNAVLEAMAAGLPVVATRVGGVPELVEEDVTGHLVASGDAAALALRLGRLSADRERARGLGRAGQARARELFELERMVSQTAALHRAERRRRAA